MTSPSGWGAGIATREGAGEYDGDGSGQDDGKQADAQAGEVRNEADQRRGQQEPHPQQPADDRQTGPGGQAGQLVCGMHGGRDEGGKPQAGENEPGQGGAECRYGEGGAHAERGEHATGARDGALAEPVHDAVAGEPATNAPIE
jgi:hypothetical protein